MYGPGMKDLYRHARALQGQCMKLYYILLIHYSTSTIIQCGSLHACAQLTTVKIIILFLMKRENNNSIKLHSIVISKKQCHERPDQTQ